MTTVSYTHLDVYKRQANKIKFYIGNALELVPRLDITFDLAFIDGDKRLSLIHI